MEHLNNIFLESGISKMILDNKKDLEELLLKDISIRKNKYCDYKIYDTTNNNEYQIITKSNYDTESMKENIEYLYLFLKELLFSFKSLKTYQLMNNPDKFKSFYFKILEEFIIEIFKRDKNYIIKILTEDNIEEYIKQEINDSVEDIIYQSQFNCEVRKKYRDYDFIFKYHEVEYEDDVDINLDGYDEYRRDCLQEIQSQKEFLMFLEDNEEQEIERFKKYLDNQGLLLDLEIKSIRNYLYNIVFVYDDCYRDFVKYIFGEKIESDDEDEEEDIEMEN